MDKNLWMGFQSTHWLSNTMCISTVKSFPNITSPWTYIQSFSKIQILGDSKSSGEGPQKSTLSSNSTVGPDASYLASTFEMSRPGFWSSRVPVTSCVALDLTCHALGFRPSLGQGIIVSFWARQKHGEREALGRWSWWLFGIRRWVRR